MISQPLLYLSAYLEAHRLDDYERLLAVSQRGEWENWLLFFLKGISSQSLDAITRIERLGQLRTAYRERLRTERAAARLLQTLDVLFERPILNIRQLEAALEVPYRTAELTANQNLRIRSAVRSRIEPNPSDRAALPALFAQVLVHVGEKPGCHRLGDALAGAEH